MKALVVEAALDGVGTGGNVPIRVSWGGEAAMDLSAAAIEEGLRAAGATGSARLVPWPLAAVGATAHVWEDGQSAPGTAVVLALAGACLVVRAGHPWRFARRIVRKNAGAREVAEAAALPLLSWGEVREVKVIAGEAETISKLLGERLGVPAVAVAAPKGVRWPEGALEYGADIAPDEADLRPDAYRRAFEVKRMVDRARRAGIAGAVAAGGAAMLLAILAAVWSVQATAAAEAMRSPEMARVREVAELNRTLRERLRGLGNGASETAWGKLLAKAGDVAPEGLWLESVDAAAGEKGSVVTLAGKATGKAAILAYLGRLESAGGWSALELRRAVSDPATGKVAFEIKGSMR